MSPKVRVQSEAHSNSPQTSAASSVSSSSSPPVSFSIGSPARSIATTASIDHSSINEYENESNDETTSNTSATTSSSSSVHNNSHDSDESVSEGEMVDRASEAPFGRSPPALDLNLPYTGLHHSSCTEFNDGTVSPLPSDPWNYDPYTAAWHSLCLTEREEEDCFNSPDYRYFVNALKDGRLIVSTRDLTHIDRWKALGFFLSNNSDVQSLRFHGVDLQVSAFRAFKQSLLKSSLTNHHRARQRTPAKDSNHPNVPGPTSPTTPLSYFHTEWSGGGWGIDIDGIVSARRRRREITVRHVAFVENHIGTHIQEEVKTHTNPTSTSSYTRNNNSTTAAAATATAADLSPSGKSSSSTGLDNVIFLLLFFDLLDTVHIWRNNLNDSHVRKLMEELVLKHPNLRKLSLRWNGITTDGARAIETILRTMSKNMTFARSSSNNGAQQQQPLGGSKFQELDLAFNRIDLEQEENLFRDAYHQQPPVQRSVGANLTVNDQTNSTTTTTTTTTTPVVTAVTQRPKTPTLASTSTSPPNNSVTSSTPIIAAPSSSAAAAAARVRQSLPTQTSSASSPPRRLYTVNLHPQLPHSARSLSAFLRFTPWRHHTTTTTTTNRYGCASAHTDMLQQQHGDIFMNTPVTSSA